MSEEPVPEPTYDVVLHVNGVLHPATVPARRLLSDALRHDLRLTGTHVGSSTASAARARCSSTAGRCAPA